MDPIADFLTNIKNGYLAHKKEISVPYSNVREKLGKIFTKEGFLGGIEIEGSKPQEKKLKMKLKYHNKVPAITQIRKISKPGLRVYAHCGEIPISRRGFGVTIVSTSSGMMTHKEAKSKKLGGEVICQVW
jgi:small subunit ribosomal protein S8